MFGYAKIFVQIYDSSIAKDWQVRHVFEDLLILSNSDGVVDMTVDAIARRTNTPLEIVQRAITELERPDPESRSDTENGARIKRLDPHRTWGWWIVNHQQYRDMASDEQYRVKTRERVRKFRENAKKTPDVTLRNVTVTPGNACNAKQKQMAEPEAEGGGRPARADFDEVPTADQAFAATMNLAVPRAFSDLVYEDWVGRSGKDGAGVPVKWFNYVKKRWTREQGEWKNGTHGRNKSPATGQNGHQAPNGAQTVILGKEYDRIVEEMKTLKGTYGDHQTWGASDITRFNKLKARKLELKPILGITV